MDSIRVSELLEKLPGDLAANATPWLPTSTDLLSDFMENLLEASRADSVALAFRNTLHDFLMDAARTRFLGLLQPYVDPNSTSRLQKLVETFITGPSVDVMTLLYIQPTIEAATFLEAVLQLRQLIKASLVPSRFVGTFESSLFRLREEYLKHLINALLGAEKANSLISMTRRFTSIERNDLMEWIYTQVTSQQMTIGAALKDWFDRNEHIDAACLDEVSTMLDTKETRNLVRRMLDSVCRQTLVDTTDERRLLTDAFTSLRLETRVVLGRAFFASYPNGSPLVEMASFFDGFTGLSENEEPIIKQIAVTLRNLRARDLYMILTQDLQRNNPGYTVDVVTKAFGEQHVSLTINNLTSYAKIRNNKATTQAIMYTLKDCQVAPKILNAIFGEDQMSGTDILVGANPAQTTVQKLEQKTGLEFSTNRPITDAIRVSGGSTGQQGEIARPLSAILSLTSPSDAPIIAGAVIGTLVVVAAIVATITLRMHNDQA